MATPPDPFGQSSSGSYGFPPPASGSGSPTPPRPATGSGLAIAGPPTAFLAAAGGLALVGVVIGAFFGSGPLAVVGWVAAGPLAIGVLSAFTLVDTSRRAMPVYTEASWVKPAYWGVLALAAVGIVLCALRIADWIGRL